MTLYKLQIGCIVVFFYIVLHYLQSKNMQKKDDGHKEFYAIIILTAFYYVFDILTVYTVNHLEIVPPLLNRIAHACYLCSLNALEYLVFYYLIKISGKYPQVGRGKFFLWMVFGINIAAVLLTIGQLYYVEGVETNYSMGIPAYITYGMCIVYVIMSIVVFIQSWNYFEKSKRKSIGVYLAGMVTVLIIQSVFPETLISCLGITLFILSIYINIENPYIKVLTHFQGEFSVGMADIVEYRDNNTGGHIRRTAAYAEMLAKEMRRGGGIPQGFDKGFC